MPFKYDLLFLNYTLPQLAIVHLQIFVHGTPVTADTLLPVSQYMERVELNTTVNWLIGVEMVIHLTPHWKTEKSWEQLNFDL